MLPVGSRNGNAAGPLEALVQFWLAVILRAPRALSQALYETLEGSEPLFPLVQASPEAFFQRCQALRPAFFAEVFTRFTTRLLAATPPRDAQDLGPLRARFGNRFGVPEEKKIAGGPAPAGLIGNVRLVVFDRK